MRPTIKHINRTVKDGTHLVTIIEVTDTLERFMEGLWLDRTPQLRIKFKAANGAVLNLYMDLIGYHTKNSPDCYRDGGCELKHIKFIQHPISKELYAVDTRNNRRIEDKNKTAQLHSAIQNLAHDCGIIGEFNLADLLNKQLQITVVNGKIASTGTILSQIGNNI